MHAELHRYSFRFYFTPLLRRLFRRGAAINDTVAFEAEPLSRFGSLVLEFAVHVVIGTTIFILLAAPAALIDLAIRRFQLPYAVATILTIVEYILFTANLLLFAAFVMRTVLRFFRKI